MEILAVILAVALGYHIVFSERRQTEMLRVLNLIATRAGTTTSILQDRFDNVERRVSEERMMAEVGQISQRLYEVHKTLRGEDRHDDYR